MEAWHHRFRLLVISFIQLCLLFILSVDTQALPMFPWETHDSVENALIKPPASSVHCEGVMVERIEARNSPPYYVICDPFQAENKIVVLGRVPLAIRRGHVVDVQGVIGELPNGEKCIESPVAHTYMTVDGAYSNWAPFLGLGAWPTKQVLQPFLAPIPPSDPSLPNDGLGVAGPVSANSTKEPQTYETVQELLSSPPVLFSVVNLKCKPIASTGYGYIMVGDDSTTSQVKVYTNASVGPGDRVITLTATAHSENGQLVLYAGSGMEPFFDVQAESGSVFTASPGTTAYASSIADAQGITPNNRISLMSVIPPSTPDNGWVYLTGRMVTGVGRYYSDGDPDDSSKVYYIQSLDRTSGIRVLDETDALINMGDVVDVMGQVTTVDGERIIGIKDVASSVETTFWDRVVDSSMYVRPVFINNRSLGGSPLGSNPGVTGGFGLYNIGSRIKTTGRVVGKGYCYTQYTYYGVVPYIQIDDGSHVSDGQALKTHLEGCYSGNVAGPNGGVMVLEPQDYSLVQVGDYVSVTGVSSQWTPVPGGDSYRAIRFATSVEVVDPAAVPSSGEVVESYDIPIEVYVYGAANQEVAVDVYTNTGKSWTHTITCNANGIGTDSFTWADVPAVIDLDGAGWNFYYPYYTVSTQCDGFKTRTDSGLSPGLDTAYLRLVPLRKIDQIQTSSYDITSCPSSNTATLYTYVWNSDHTPIVGQSVRFWTSAGTFASDGTDLRDVTVTTDSNGKAEVTLYAGYPTGPRSAFVMATDDMNTPLPNSYEHGEIHDWVPLKSTYVNYYEKDYISIAEYHPIYTVTPTSDPGPRMKRCQDMQFAAHLEACGSNISGNQVTFKITYGVGTINESTAADKLTYTTTTNSSGNATATVHPTGLGLIYLEVKTSIHGQDLTENRYIEVKEFSPAVTAAADPAVIHAAGESTVTFHAKDIYDANKPGLPIQVSASAGSLLSYPSRSPLPNPTAVNTDSNGDAKVIVRLDPAESAVVSGTYTDDCLGLQIRSASIRYCQTPWISGIGAGYSSPLVADLIPGGEIEVALITKGDGRIRIWESNGSLEWTSNQQIDTGGDNTLSAANIDSDTGSTLEIAAPSHNTEQMFVFGYDSGFKSLAGWPTISFDPYQAVSAALGDSNLDGTMKIIAGDGSCEVDNWNATNMRLWNQATGSSSIAIVGTSVALGAINTTSDSNRAPEAIVGANTTPGIWGYEGNEWGTYFPSYEYTPRFNMPSGCGSVNSSPAIGPIDNDATDTINDIAVGSNAGLLWVWLSKDSQWHTYDAGSCINSSPALVNYNGQHLIVFGCDNGKVYAVRWDSLTSSLVDAAGWSSGILLDGSNIKASPIVGDVINTGNEPQIVVATKSGNVYALHLDGCNHTGGNPIAKVWSCTQNELETIYSTPTLCSLDGSTISLIVASSNDIYKIDLYSGTFDPVNNVSRWPWTTFHRDIARTGCATNSSTVMRSASIVGRVSHNGVPVQGASVKVEWHNGTSWVKPAVYERPSAQRPTLIYTVGNSTPGDEVNEGGFVINQLPPNTSYRLTISKTGYTTKQITVPVTTGRASYQNISL